MIEFIHQISQRSRSLRIKIEDDGSVVVVTPPHVSYKQAAAFVEQNQVWVLTHQQKVKQKTPVEDSNQVMIFGKWYQKKQVYEHHQPIGVTIQKETLIINTIKPIATPAEIQKQIERFLKNTAEKYIIPRTHQLAQKMDVSFHHITLRQQKSRWGSRSSSGTISFNWRLVHYPPEVIDYVIIHELSHVTYMDHSTRFWQRVRQFDDKYLEHRRYLKKFGTTVS